MNTLYTDLQKLVQEHCENMACVNGALLAKDLCALLENHKDSEQYINFTLENLREEIARLTGASVRGNRKEFPIESWSELHANSRRYLEFFKSGLPITFHGVDHYTKDSLDQAIDILIEG